MQIVYLCSMEFLSLWFDFFDYPGVQIHCSYPHAHGFTCFGHFLYFFRHKIRIINILLKLCQYLRLYVFLIIF